MKIKAKTKGARRRGRPRKEGVMRTRSGQISRSVEARAESEAMAARLALEAATWKRRQVNPMLTIEEARKQEYGSVIHAWKVAHDKFVERHGEDEPDPMQFTKDDLEIARQIHEAYSAYRAAISARNPRSSSDFSGPGGFDGTDPFSQDRAIRERKAIERWTGKDGKGGMRRAILESGPVGMMAVEGIVFENKPLAGMVGDLRLAINAVERIGRFEKAA